MLASIQQRLVRIMPQGGFLRNVAILAGGTAFAQAITILVSPILTRLYAPQDLGNLSVYISLFSLIVVIASLRYEMAIPLPKDDETAANILVLCILIVFGMTILSAVLVLFLGASIVKLVNAPQLEPYLWILPISLFGVGIYQVLSYWAIRKGAFARIAQTKLSQSLGQVTTQIVLGLLKVGTVGLLLGDAVGRMSGIGTLSTLTWKQNGAVFRDVSWQRIKEAANRYRRFPLISSWATLLNSINQFSPPLLTAALYSTQVAGWLALAQTVLGAPSLLLATSVAQVYMSEAARISKRDPQGQERLFWKTLSRLTLAGLPVLIVIGFLAPWVFQIVFGSGWEMSARYIQILTPMFFFQFLGSPLSGALDVMERQDLQVWREMIRMILLFGAAFFSQAAQVGAIEWIMLFSAVTSIAYMAYIALSLVAIRTAQPEPVIIE